jgi:mutator protein MutT
MKRAVVALIFNKDGKILGVSRKNNPNDMGLPGGKVDPGETLTEAIIREVREETGLNVKTFKPIFELEDGEFLGVTFACTVEGEISTTETGRVDWIEWEELFAGTFSEYNRNLYQHLKNTNQI